MKRKGIVRNNPVTTAGAGGLSLTGLLAALEASPKVIAVVAWLLAVATWVVRDLTRPEGSQITTVLHRITGR